MSAPIPHEEWRPVVGYEGIYSVSSLGRVRRDLICHGTRSQPYVLKNSAHNRKGYLNVSLHKDRKHHTRLVHHLVAEAFIGPRAPGAEVNHRNGDKTDNTPGNLEYMTKLENIAHATEHGLRSHSERHRSARLTSDNVREIRRALAAGVTGVDLGKRFHVSPNAIYDIRDGVTWRRVA